MLFFLLFGRAWAPAQTAKKRTRPRPNSKKENTRKAQTTKKTRQQKKKHSYRFRVIVSHYHSLQQTYLVSSPDCIDWDLSATSETIHCKSGSTHVAGPQVESNIPISVITATILTILAIIAVVAILAIIIIPSSIIIPIITIMIVATGTKALNLIPRECRAGMLSLAVKALPPTYWFLVGNNGTMSTPNRKPPPLHGDYGTDPDIEVLKRREFINQGSTL